ARIGSRVHRGLMVTTRPQSHKIVCGTGEGIAGPHSHAKGGRGWSLRKPRREAKPGLPQTPAPATPPRTGYSVGRTVQVLPEANFPFRSEGRARAYHLPGTSPIISGRGQPSLHVEDSMTDHYSVEALKPKYKRVVLKLSGEGFGHSGKNGISID